MKTPALRHLTVLAAALILAVPAWAGDATSKIITVSTDSITVGKKHSKTYKITTATVVQVNGAKATVQQLKDGMDATVTAAGDTATSIAATTEKPKKAK